MGGARHDESLKKRVLAMGAAGKTYAEIQKRYPIPKSTLSFWFSAGGAQKTRDRKEHLATLRRARAAAEKTIRKKREERIAASAERAAQCAKRIRLRDTNATKSLLAMLYWAEGTKSDRASLVFANTDPQLLSFYLGMLRSSFSLDESRLRIRLHLHQYHDQTRALRFWSGLLGVPQSQFGKIYVKKRSVRKKFRENFQGTCFVIYHDTAVRRELMALGKMLAEQFEKSSRM